MELLMLELNEKLNIDTLITFTEEADIMVELIQRPEETTLAVGYGSEVEEALTDALIKALLVVRNLN